MDILTVLYSASGLVFGIAFVPQIVRLAKDRSGAASISLSMWLVFAFCSSISLAYACAHNGDVYFIFCSSIGVVGNLTVLFLAALRRIQILAHPAPALARV